MKKKSAKPGAEEDVGRHLLLVRGETFIVSELGWRNLVFVPFNTYWLVVVTAATLFQQFFDIYHQIYNKPPTDIYFYGSLTAWLVFVLDTAFSIIHRLWERVNRARRYTPKSWTIILLDTICAHPTLIVNFMYFDQVPLIVKWFVVVVDFIRLYRIFVFYEFLKAKMGLNQLFLHMIFYVLIVAIIADIFAVMWMTVENYTGNSSLAGRFKDPYWSTHILLFNILLGTSVDNLYPGTPLDVCLLLFPVFTWFCLNRLFIIILLMDFLKKLGHHFSYRSTIGVAEIHLSNIGIKKRVREDFLNFYDTLWDLWWGITWEESLDQLPLSMRKETLVDVSWDAIQHSRSLRFQGINFKRDLALQIKSVMYRPMDYVFDYNEIKSLMLYLVSGALQVMSAHDSTCPLISFSRGTILGGGSIIVPSVSNIAVRSQSYAETHILRMHQLFHVALRYPWETRYMHLRAYDRLQDAYTMIKVEEIFRTRKKMYDEILIEPEIKCIRWMKLRWKLINSFDVATDDEAKNVVQHIPVFEQFTSRYLDLYVISEDLELKKNRFCLEAMWPFVMEPECSFLKFWNSFILVLVCADSLVLPYQASFMHNIPYYVEHLSVFNQLMFMLDTYFHLITAIKTKDVVIMTAKEIVKYRLKRIGFGVDLISAFPIGILNRLMSTPSKVAIYWDLLRLFKTWRAIKILVRMEANIKNPATMPWLRHTIVYVFLIYWSSCLIFAMSCPDSRSCTSDGWVTTGQEQLRMRSAGQDTRCFSSYVAISLFYIMTATHQINSSNINTNSEWESFAICILTAITQTYVIYFTSHVTAVDLLSESLHISFSSLVKNTSDFMRKRGMPKGLTKDLVEYLNLQWSHDRAHEFLLPKKLFHDAPEKLNAELSNYFKEVLSSYKIFAGKTEGTKYMIDRLTEKARIVMLPKYFVICSTGSRASCLTIVRKGYCRLISHLKADVAKFPDGKLVGAGAMFPLAEIVSKTPSALTVYTVTNCECIVIEEPDFVQAWETSENIYSESVLSSPRALEIITKLNQEFEHNFTPVIHDTLNTSFVLRKPFFCDKSNLFRVILHLCFPKYCFSPLGSFLFYWEMSRFILIPLSINFFVLYYILFYSRFPLPSMVASLCFDFLSIVDVVLRFNTGYYNKDGVFVSDTCLVVYRYLITAFIVDFMGAFPWQILFQVKKVVDLPWLILAFFKTLPLYRVIKFNLILAKRGTFKMTFHIYTFAVVFVTMVNFIASNNLLYLCFVEYGDNYYQRIYCKQQLITSNAFDSSKIGDVMLLSVGAFFGTILKLKTEIEQALNYFEMFLGMAYGLIMNLLLILFVVKCCRWAISGPKDYTLFKHDVDNLDRYLKKNSPDDKIQKTIQNCFEHYWENRMPQEIFLMLSKVHPALRVKALYHLYFEKLRLVSFLEEARDYMLRALAQEVKEMFLLKGQTIVEEFEITKNAYIISTGEIVVSVGKISPVVLGPGCVFGCLNSTGYTKHVLTFEVRKNASILKIDSSHFHSVLKKDKDIYQRFIKLCLPAREYVVSGQEIVIESSSIDLTEVVVSNNLMTTSSSNYVFIYLIITYMVAFLTLVLLGLFLLFGPADFIIYSLLIVDLLTLWKIITQFSLPYVDPTTGFTVKNKRLIRMRYIKTIDFYIDLICFIPYIGIGWFLVIKLLRIYEASRLILQRRDSFLLKNWEVWVHSFLCFIVVIFILGVSWALVIGKDMQIYHFLDGKLSWSSPSSTSEMFVNSMLVVMIILTQHGRVINLKFPATKLEIFIAITVSTMAVLLLGIFHGKLSHFVEKVTWAKRLYENKMKRQWQYLKMRELSQCILESVWQHGELLWHHSRGEYMPSALYALPYPLRKRIMYSLFGRHLENSYLFKNTHVEFVKNLCARLQMMAFFPGESVVMEGDVDGTMYFIHSGEVDVLKKTGKDEEKLEGILTVGQIFGFCQGLYEYRPHTNTYKARSTCEILLLKRERWHDLMMFYDAQTLTVYRRAAKLPYEFPIFEDYNYNDK